MTDEIAYHEPNARTTIVPKWAEETQPWLDKVVIGPPKGHEVTGDIRAVEMLMGEDDGQPVRQAFLRIPQEVAQRMADNDGGWVQMGMIANFVVPFYMTVYTAPKVKELE